MHRILRWTPKASRKLSRFSLGAVPASERVHLLPKLQNFFQRRCTGA